MMPSPTPTDPFFPRAGASRVFLRWTALIAALLYAHLFALSVGAGPLDPRDYPDPVRVACVGDSITAGSGTTDGRTFPAQLQERLGDNWRVRNFGVSGRTLLRKGDFPYWKENTFQEARAFRPDAVIILLGANDTKPQNWRYKDEFPGDYIDLVNIFRDLPSTPRIFVCRPTPVPGEGNFGINEPAVQEEIVVIDRLAAELGLEVIDMHAALEGKPEFIPDRVHPNNDGCAEMAKAAAFALTDGRDRLGPLTRLSSLFRSHAVLQRDVPAPVWGTSAPEQEVTVAFAGQEVSATADDEGRWRVLLDPLPASATPRTLTVTGNRTVHVEDVLVGDVWLAGGQSNMERQLGPRRPQKDLIGWREAARTADFPLIREHAVPRAQASKPVVDADGRWTVCTPASVTNFSAIGFYFARDLQPAIGVPVGIIHSSWGGTVAEAWTSEAALRALPEFAELFALRDSGATPEEIAERWLAVRDPGSGDGHWEAPDLKLDAAWSTKSVPATVEVLRLRAQTGVFWFRRELDLPAGAPGMSGRLRLGQIDDEDTVWINGVKIGANTRWNVTRDYDVPAGVLREGRNVIAVRLINTRGAGGWMSDASELSLDLGDGTEKIPLAGDWHARMSVNFYEAPYPNVPASQNAPARLFNAMIAPLTNYPIKGVIWYQGESNNGRPDQYRALLPALITDWRAQWRQPGLSFLVVQIAPNRRMVPELREAQLQTVRSTPATALIVTTDVGDANDIHPANKAPVGARLALAARAVAYGESIEYSGPMCESMAIVGDKIVLAFTHAGGLAARGGELTGFTIAGADGAFVPAHAEIHGKKVEVWSEDVAHPTAVRYGWANVPEGNLFNQAGLPASPFRTDG